MSRNRSIDILSIDHDFLLQQLRSFIRNLLQKAFHDGKETTRSDVFSAFVDLHRRSGNRIQPVLREFQADSLRFEQRMILPGQRALRLGQDPS